MTPKIARHCPNCKEYQEITLIHPQKLNCPGCAAAWGEVATLESIFDRCPLCENRQFYQTKNFNQFAGCLIMAIGIVLVPWTFGLSLPVFALIDWLLYRRVKSVVVCYKCGGEFHDFSAPKAFKPFIHAVGLKYDKYR